MKGAGYLILRTVNSPSENSPLAFIIINIDIELSLPFIAFAVALLNSNNISDSNQVGQVLLLVGEEREGGVTVHHHLAIS